MATFQDATENLTSIPLTNINPELIEDAYGYVDPFSHSRKISRDIMMQLPSHQLDNLDTQQSQECCSYGTQKKMRTLKRSETRYKTMKIKRVTMHSESMDDDVEKVYELLTADPDEEQEEIKNNLRELHQSLTLKRMVKAKLDAQHENKIRLSPLSAWARCRCRIIMAWQHLKYGITDISYSLELWQGVIKKIQGHFGSGVASYFIFLRWLLCLNLFNYLVSFGFIVVPQAVYENNRNFSYDNNTPEISFSGSDILTGSGWIGNSSFFYGYYTNETIEIVDGYRYDMPLAYLFTVGVAGIVNLIVVAYCVTKTYQNIYIDSSGPLKNKLCEKIFCAWDYTIEKSDTAMLQHRLIHNGLKELLSSELKARKSESMAIKVLKVIVCFLVNVFVMATILTIGYFVYFILENKAVEVETQVLKNMTLSLTVTSISFIFHYLISYATKLEFFFSKQVQLYLTLVRVAALRIVILSVLVYFWIVNPETSDTMCYESLLGEEIYRLILINFLMNLIVCTIFGEFFVKLMSKFLGTTCSFIKSPEFDVAYNTNDLIYYQTLIWVGAFYSPMLPLLLIIILVVMFYMKVYSVILNCRPSEKPWSAAQAQTVFLVLTLMNLLLTGMAVGYVIFSVNPSTTCGPFRTWTTTYSAIEDWFSFRQERESSQLMAAGFKYASSPGLPLAVVLALCFAVYYARAYALANEKTMKHVREQLILESKDKVFLLQLFDNAYRDWKKHQNFDDECNIANNKYWTKDELDDFEIHEHGDILQQNMDNHTSTNLETDSPLLSSSKYNNHPDYEDASPVKRNIRRHRDISASSSENSTPRLKKREHYIENLQDLYNKTASPLNQSRHQHGLIQYPGHKQGFQYGMHDENPTRSSNK